ncbi:MAG: acyl-CoA dehydratase activase-related protein, partial [bacterium]
MWGVPGTQLGIAGGVAGDPVGGEAGDRRGVEAAFGVDRELARGCGGAGNKCRIDRITTEIAGEQKPFTWGGACSLYDRGTGKKKLPDLAPDPFRRREEMVAELVRRMTEPRGGKRIALTDEFLLKELFPFFLTFFRELGLDPVVPGAGTHATLKRGIEGSNVPFCAPMQMYHGIVSSLVGGEADFLFLPMLRDIPRAGAEPHSVTCPIEQGSADLLRRDLGAGNAGPAIVSPVLDAAHPRSPAFARACAELARTLGAGDRWEAAYAAALLEDERFGAACLALGRDALAFCAREGVVPVVVLGRGYTVYNTVLNSNVPALLREQGTIAIPLDCYPVDADVPVFRDIYWGHSQRALRAAHAVRRTPGVYSLFCSNYSCGPDSFTTHFYAYIMAGKPYAVIETDGHSGDAGTKTRIEAFLYCVRQDLAGAGDAAGPLNSLRAVEEDRTAARDVIGTDTTVLVPWLSEATEAGSAVLRGVGLRAEPLWPEDAEALRLGRRHTSGKECLPVALTLGAFLQRIQRGRPDERYLILMPRSDGPCRLGMYNVLQKIIVARLGLKDRGRVWSPSDSGYFAGLGAGFGAL